MHANESAASGSPTSAEPRILVVDDDPVIRLLASTLLRRGGYRVETANDGAEALERLSAGDPFSLLVTDLQMPNLTGAELLQAVRQSTTIAAIRVIVFTGTEDVGEEARLIDAGADDCIRKPIDPERFVARVHAVLRRANA